MPQTETEPDAPSIAFWQSAMVVGPIIGGAAPLLVVWLLGGFTDFVWINRPVTLAQSLGILCAMMFPIAAWLAARGKWSEARAYASRAWPTVEGAVDESRVERVRGGLVPFYKLVFRFRYTVDGVELLGDTVAFGPARITNADLAEQLTKRFPAGARVAVHYDPSAPAVSVLDTSAELARQNRWRIWLFAIMPFVVSVVVAIKNAD